MSKWTRESIEIAKIVRQIRKEGMTEKLAIVLESEIVDSRHWLAKRDYENQLMQQCIAGMIQGQSPCLWCEEHKECQREEHGGKGCGEWWLRFLSEEEQKACDDRAEGKTDGE